VKKKLKTRQLRTADSQCLHRMCKDRPQCRP